MNEYNLIVAIPAFNEADIIDKTISGLSNIDYIDRIVVIDDGSTDNTREIVSRLDVDLLSFDKNRGKGAALKEVFSKYKFKYICLIDADLGLSSIESRKLIEPVLNGEVDFTIAQFPKRSKPGKKAGFGLVKNLARKGVKFYSKRDIDNSLSGQRVYSKEVIDSISYIPNNYGIEVAMTSKALKEGFSYKNIAVEMTHRYSDGSFKGYFHRAKQFWHILKTFIIMFFKRW